MADLAKVSVCEVRSAVPAGAGIEAGMVVLREEAAPGRLLRIIIGQPEARAIQASWSGTVAVRPTTWDLFVSAMELLDARIERGIITAVQEQRHFFGAVEFRRGADLMRLNCRASDAIALALRSSGAEIVADALVLSTAGYTDSAVPEPSSSPGDGGGAVSPGDDVGPWPGRR